VNGRLLAAAVCTALIAAGGVTCAGHPTRPDSRRCTTQTPPAAAARTGRRAPLPTLTPTVHLRLYRAATGPPPAAPPTYLRKPKPTIRGTR